MIIDNMGEYVLYRWPECQQFMDLEGFEEHSSLADCDLFGPSAYFIEKEWIESLDEKD